MNTKSLLCLLIVTIHLLAFARGYGSRTTVVKHSDSGDPEANGFWDRKVTWKARWVKYWKPKAIYVPVWKKVWGPVVSNEWVPIPKPPPGWQKDPASKTSDNTGYRTSFREEKY